MIRDSRTLPASCHVVIVGAGLAGLETTLALEREKHHGVVVLDAGPAADLRHINASCAPDDALAMWLDYDADPCFRRSWLSDSPPHYATGSGLRRRVGGRSLYWHGVVLPIEDWALIPPWPSTVVSDLRESWRQGDSLYDRVRRDLRQWALGGTVSGAFQAPANEVSPMLADVHLSPVPRAVRRSTRHADRWLAYSPLDEWRDAETGSTIQEPDGVTLYAGAEVVNVIVANGAARGVVVKTNDGDRRTVRAETVVLAAGTVENSRLAIQALCENGSSVTRLGGLVDHMVQGVYARVSRPAAHRLKEHLARGDYWARCDDIRSNLFLSVHDAAEDTLHIDLQLSGEQLPSPDSYVVCTPSAAFPWAVTVCTETSPADLQLLQAQQRFLQCAWDALAALLEWPAVTLDFADYSRPSRTNAFLLHDVPFDRPLTWSNSLGTEDHEAGTLGLGIVLDDQHEFMSIRNLFSIGPCVFPRSGAANPALTVLALARRMAAILARR